MKEGETMRIRVWTLACVAVLLLFSLAQPVGAECNSYAGKNPTDFGFEYGYGCSGSGAGCSQCADYDQNGYGRVCTYDASGWWVDCYYFGHPDNQT
jgi:hypothetical protein